MVMLSGRRQLGLIRRPAAEAERERGGSAESAWQMSVRSGRATTKDRPPIPSDHGPVVIYLDEAGLDVSGFGATMPPMHPTRTAVSAILTVIVTCAGCGSSTPASGVPSATDAGSAPGSPSPSRSNGIVTASTSATPFSSLTEGGPLAVLVVERMARTPFRTRLEVRATTVTTLVEGEAREQLEARYLGGRLALLSETEEAWDRFAELVHRLWSIAGTPSETAEPIEDGDGAHDPLAGRVADRAQHLADDARISTFERLGETPRAVAVVERRLATRDSGWRQRDE